MVLAAAALTLFGTGCGSSATTAASHRQAGRTRSIPSTLGTRPTTTVPPTTTTVPPTTTVPAEPGWAPLATTPSGVAVDEQTYGGSAGAVTLVRFRAPLVHYALHVGSGDPPGGSGVPGAPGPAIGPAEQPILLAAFNGGFEAGAGAEGFEVQSQVLEPLQAGLASLVIDANGHASVGIWGQTVPQPGEQVTSVRQNLQPLVAGGQPSPDATDVGAWGATLGGGSVVARSALGEDAQGNLVFAGSMSALPSDMAAALVQAGVTTGMELDINPEWVQLAYAATPGGPLTAGIPGQNRPADQYLDGWTRDFVTVLAGTPG